MLALQKPLSGARCSLPKGIIKGQLVVCRSRPKVLDHHRVLVEFTIRVNVIMHSTAVVVAIVQEYMTSSAI